MLNAKDSKYIKSYHYDNPDDFIKAISYKGELYNLFERNFIFRGQATDKYELLPSALRGNLVLDNLRDRNSQSEDQIRRAIALSTTEFGQVFEEYRLLQEFACTCDNNGLYIPHIDSLQNSFLPRIDADIILFKHKWLPKSYWELAALAQHHGIKTRLLDWTHDIYVAIYFATTGTLNIAKERLKWDINTYRAHMQGESLFQSHNMEIWALNMGVLMAKPAAMPLHIVQPRYHNNDNLCAQKGVFTFWETVFPEFPIKDVKPDLRTTDRRTLDTQLDSYLSEINSPSTPYLYYITIPQDAAPDFFFHVARLGYNASALFPGYDGVVKHMNECMKMRSKKK